MIRLRALGGAIALLGLVPLAAAAQPARSPFADLFGRAPLRTGNEFTAVQFRTQAGAQWGQTLREDFDQADAVPEGLAGGVDAALLAQYMRDRVQALAQGRYAYSEFRQTPAFGAPAFDTAAHINIDATSKLSLQAGAQMARSPYFRLQWLTPDVFGPELVPFDRAAILMLRNDTTELNAGISSAYTNRSTLTLTGFTRETKFVSKDAHDQSARGGRLQWRRRITRAMAFHAGYGREELRDLGTDERFTNELLDLGVDFAKALSLARRTSLTFATETSMLREQDGPRRFRVNGSIDLLRQFQRSWEFQLGAQRATEFMPGYPTPVFTERGRMSLSGYVSHRLIVNLGADGGQGEVAFGDARKFVSYNGSAKLTFAVTRHVGFFTQYYYTHYQNPPDPRGLAFPPQLSRQAVSVGVHSWLSLYDKEKVSRDPR